LLFLWVEKLYPPQQKQISFDFVVDRNLSNRPARNWKSQKLEESEHFLQLFQISNNFF